MDKALLNKIETSVDNVLLTIVRSVAAVGMEPLSVISMVRGRLDLIETMAREESHEAVADVLVPQPGDERSQAAARMATLWAQDRGDDSSQGYHPRRTEGQPLNQAELTDDDSGYWD